MRFKVWNDGICLKDMNVVNHRLSCLCWNNRSEPKDDDIKIKTKNKENEFTEKEKKISTAMSLSKSIH